MKRIFYVSSEVTPYAASGGLGDVLGALPRAVRRIAGGGLEVGVFVPLYSTISEEYKKEMREVARGEFSLAWRRVGYSLRAFSRFGVTYYFVDCPRYFDRGAMYGEFDDGERFAVFARAVLDYIEMSEKIPDVLHANDWQAALALIYLRTVFAENPRLSRIRTVFTVHNMAYQGKYDIAILSDVFDIHPMHLGILEYDGCLNLMKGALVVADRVTTVSPRYAEELRDPFFAEGLADVVRSVSYKTKGILNGIDTAYFNPKNLPIPYDFHDVSEGKARNKSAILHELSFSECEERALVVMIGRLVADKGIDLLLDILPRLRELDIFLVVLGTGDAVYEAALLRFAEENRDFMRVFTRFDRDLSKKLYASADVFLMPSRREPCGLAQMVACRYGTVPVVGGTGGLLDTIIPYGRPDGRGFVFRVHRADELFGALGDAVSLYKNDREAFKALSRHVARVRFGWWQSAKEYLALYRELEEAT